MAGKYSEEQKMSNVESFKQSGLSLGKFSRENNIPKNNRQGQK